MSRPSSVLSNDRSSLNTDTYIRQNWHTLQRGISATAELLVIIGMKHK